MKRLSLLFLLPLAGGALFGQSLYTITGTVPATGAVGLSYSASLTISPSAQVAWSYTGSLPPGLTLSPTTGTSAAASITGTPTTAGTYPFTVQASIVGAGLVASQAYTVVITPPVTISPAALPNGSVGVPYSQQLTASGGYGPGTYTFSWDAGCPGLSFSSTGTVTGTPTTVGSCANIFVSVTSQSGSNPPVSAYQNYSINIAYATVTVVAAYLPDCVVGSPCPQTLTATGGYGPGTYAFALTGGFLPPGLTLSANGAISGTPTAAGPYSFTVQVTSQSSSYPTATASGSFSINVNILAPTITTGSLPAGTVSVAYSQALAATGGTPPYTWASTGSLPDGLTLDAASGTISGTPTKAASFTFTVTVRDSQQATASTNFTIRIAPPALVITTASLPSGNVGAPYTATVTATGGTPPYTWSVTLNTLNGLSISSAGVITASPVAAGTFSVTVQVTDSAQATASKAYSITVVAGPKITTAPPLPDGVTGAAYTQQFAASGGATPYVWSVASGSIPSGLSLNTASGLLSGTPDTAGTYNFTIGVADQNGAKDSAAFSIMIVAPLTITTPSPLPGGAIGVPYATQTFAATGGTSPYQWTVAAGTALPAGLTLSAAGGLTGTPTATGSFSFTVQVADSAAHTATKAFTITVAAGLTITTASPLPNATVGIAYNQALDLTGGSAPFTWSISTGTLPAGIALNPGSLNGIPSAPGTFTFTVSVTDGVQTATRQFTLTVGASPLSITTASPLPSATVSVAYNQALASTGGSAPFTWSIASGTLPAGIALNPGSLNGIPSAPGTFTFTVSVTGGGQTATKQFTMTVGLSLAPQPTLSLPATAPPATQPALGIGIPSVPLNLTGTVTLTFAPDPPSPDDPAVQFTTGGRAADFTVSANTTQVVFTKGTPLVQIGTVSGTITLALKLTAGGVDVTPSPAPTTTLTIAKSAPVIKSATVTRTSGGFNLVVVGYATSREMVSAVVTFTPAAGVTLSSNTATISLTQAFTTWYADPTSAQYGSNFSLTIPFTIANGTNPLASVSVVLTNAQGSSNSMSAAY